MSGEFGRIISDDMVEDAVVETLRKWLSTYLAEVEQEAGLERGYYQRPAEGSYHVRNDFDKWPEEMLPAIIVVSTGLADTPAKTGRGIYRASWSIGVAAVVSSTDQVKTRRYAYRMAAAIRELLVNKQSLDMALGGSLRGINWLDGRNNELPEPDPAERTLWASRQLFAVEVDQVGSQFAGPIAPEPQPDPVEPYPDVPTVSEGGAGVTLTKEPING